MRRPGNGGREGNCSGIAHLGAWGMGGHMIYSMELTCRIDCTLEWVLDEIGNMCR